VQASEVVFLSNILEPSVNYARRLTNIRCAALTVFNILQLKATGSFHSKNLGLCRISFVILNYLNDTFEAP